MVSSEESENRISDRSYEKAVRLYVDRLQQLERDGEHAAQAAGDVALPVPDRGLLERLAQEAEALSRTRPSRGWLLMTVVDEAAQQAPEPLVRALAAWHLARAANDWCRPARAEPVLERAEVDFAAAGEQGWLAACRWQRYAVPWMQENLTRCVQELQEAADALAAAGAPFAPMLANCRLTLAYAQTLVGAFDAAEQNVTQAEATFKQEGNTLALARCGYTRAAVLRRRSQIDEATAELEAALAVFEARSPLDEALARCQSGFLLLLGPANYEAAEATFAQALAAFEMLDLPPWQAVCHGGLAQAQIMTGRLAQAGAALQQALSLFEVVDVPGQQAATLLDIGWLESQRGEYGRSLAALQQAEEITERVGNRWLHAASLMHLGETNLRLGRYQEALRHLEEAVRRFEALSSPLRVAECQLRLADAWTQLGRVEPALELLEAAAKHARQAGQVNILPYASYRRANGYFQLGRPAEALAALEEALVLAGEQNDRPGKALAQRLLGEALSVSGEGHRALDYLRRAETAFAQMGMVMEQAACLVALGYHYHRAGEAQAAREAWENALGQSRELMPDVDWQARAGLALLAEEKGDEATALAAYDRALNGLRRLRAGLWQPALVGSYVRRWEPTLERAVSLAAESRQARQALCFMEEGKAQLMARHLGASWNHDRVALLQNDELATLKAEIGWLQDQLRASFGQGRNLAQQRQRLGELAGKVHYYEAVLEQRERQTLSDPPSEGSRAFGNSGFSIERFRALAEQKLPPGWLALDYYRAGKQLYCAALSAQDCIVSQVASGRLAIALRNLTQPPAADRDFNQRDLALAGQRLLPEAVQEQLSPETRLVIAPHADLHGLPWAALRPDDTSPLVAHCVPLVVPSLQTLAMLWQRAQAGPEVDDGPGLLLALSTFANEHQPLPDVAREAALLAPLLGPNGRALRDEEATWQNLLALVEKRGLQRFSFLHLASHAFHDGVSGRLSGLALYDRDVYLDELWHLAPLPPLVTLSACSGSRSMVLGGDEHVGLATTCLAAGAQQVVASLWPIPDAAPAQLMAAFYSALQRTSSPATALARAQRQAWQAGEPAAVWGAFRCTGTG